MKKIYVFISLVVLMLTIAACGTTNNNEGTNPNTEPAEPNVTDDVNENPNTDTTNGTNGADGANGTNGANGTDGNNTAETNTAQDAAGQQDMQAKMDELEYADFDLSVEYAGDTEYEAELERNSNNSVEAKIEDSRNNVKKKGADAFDDLHPLVQKLTINQQTSKEEAIQEILEVFNLPTDYQEFDLEIRFKDGTKIEFEDRK